MKFFTYGVIALALLLLAIVAYEQYGEVVKQRLFGQGDTYVIYVNRVAFRVSVADDVDERKLGLSGTPSLGKYEGKLFIFDTVAKQGIWMKDMLFPIDILWFNDKFELIHIESNITPETYPAIFAPPAEARFVLELNAFAASTYAIPLGSSLTLPTAIIPGDLKNTFQAN
jgi:uncharacterized membrane protein (UPF0127 family)